jgi:hypothetical protein
LKEAFIIYKNSFTHKNGESFKVPNFRVESDDNNSEKVQEEISRCLAPWSNSKTTILNSTARKLKETYE